MKCKQCDENKFEMVDLDLCVDCHVKNDKSNNFEIKLTFNQWYAFLEHYGMDVDKIKLKELFIDYVINSISEVLK